MNIDGYTVIRFLPSGRVQLRDSDGNIFTARLSVSVEGTLKVA